MIIKGEGILVNVKRENVAITTAKFMNVFDKG